MPETVGVPLIVIVLDEKIGVIPVGNPVKVPIPVTPVVLCVIEGVNAVLIHIEGDDEAAPTLH